MFKKTMLLALIIVFMATIVSGCPWDDDGDDPSPVKPLDPTPDPDDDDEATSKPKITPKPWDPKAA